MLATTCQSGGKLATRRINLCRRVGKDWRAYRECIKATELANVSGRGDSAMRTPLGQWMFVERKQAKS